MTVTAKAVFLGLLGVFLTGLPGLASDRNNGADNTQKIIMILEEQDARLTEDMRRIHREIAALRSDFEKPGFREVAAGIGYILGLFGTAAWVASRRRR
jgi:hypothetical protein